MLHPYKIFWWEKSGNYIMSGWIGCIAKIALLSVFIRVYLSTLREGEAPTSVSVVKI